MVIKIKAKYLIGIIILVLSIAILIFMYLSRYSNSDITADNYRKLLKQSNESILAEADGISRCLPGNITNETKDTYDLNFNLWQSNTYSETENELEQITKSTEQDWLFITYANKLTKIRCQANWKGTKTKNLVSCAINDIAHKGYYDRQYKIMVDKLILNEGYALKESTLKSGSDILIKDNESNFIIVAVSGSYSKSEISRLFFSTYSKKKYF